MSKELQQFITEHGIAEVECIVPDMNGVQRGKVLPARKFLSSVKDGTLRIPGSIFTVTVTGEYPEGINHIIPDYDPDMVMVPDAATIREAPGFRTPTAQGLDPGDCAGTGILSGRYQYRPRFPAVATVGAIRSARKFQPALWPGGAQRIRDDHRASL